MTKHYCDNCGKELEEDKAITVRLTVFGPEICASLVPPMQYELCRSCLEEKCGLERVKRWYEDTQELRELHDKTLSKRAVAK